MKNIKNKRGAEIVNIYTPLGWMKILLICVTLLMLCFHFPMLLWASSVTDGFPSFIFIFLIPLYAGLLWYTVMICTQTRLIVYEDGLELQRGGSHFFATWENMSHFGRRRYGKKRNYGIFLFDRVQPEVLGFAEKLFYGSSSDYLGLSEFFIIPSRWYGFFQKTVDTEKLLNTEFGQEVYRFAPQLFETEKVKVKHGQF